MKAISAVLLLLCLCGCSPRGDLLRQTKGADRAVVASITEGYEDVKTTVTGDDLKKLIDGIAASRKVSERGLDAAPPDLRVEFYSGSERLVAMTNGIQIFWIGGMPYEDVNKTMEKLYERARREHPQMISR
jgi:hypothetical protein